ncbi:hypothetical protein BD410DRAFT_112517 [Rickenella mellea]|uniref:Uncharacterized protein n=1 Tax=Rickenella mellea TaxID=50990 RepID=A0A4Y7QBG0_9AGAM|nr:hypothetical protein BD410DRAFT_112517 [Rickenella mellea]
MTEPETQYYEHGRFKVAGGVLPNAITAYRTYGDPAAPCIVFPTCYGAKMKFGSQAYLVGEGKVSICASTRINDGNNANCWVLDPNKYFIVTFALFCNGESSSPSNTVRRCTFPECTTT